MESRRLRAAAFFDLDKTIIAKSSALVFGRPFYQGGLISRRTVLKATYAQFVYLLAGADEAQMDKMRAALTSLVAGWEAAQVREIVGEALEELINPLVYAEAVALFEDHHAHGRDVVIVSSSGAEIVEPIGLLLGADEVIATRMVVREGRYTGELDFYAYGPNKETAVRDLADRRGYDLSRSFAYSDSITDLPLLEAVGHPHAVNPDRALRKTATERGWPVLEFRRTVTLRQRVARLRPAPPVAAGAAFAAALAVATVWWTLERGRREQ